MHASRTHTYTYKLYKDSWALLGELWDISPTPTPFSPSPCLNLQVENNQTNMLQGKVWKPEGITKLMQTIASVVQSHATGLRKEEAAESYKTVHY